jgi:RNA-directed DNA polymerase
MSYKTQMYGHGESHSGIVPTRRSNAGQGGPKEIVEGRPLTKENAVEPNPHRTQSRESGPSGLDRVRQAAQRDKQLRFTALLHHINVDRLRSSYYDLKRQAAAGVDGVTWQEYGDGLEERLADLHGRIHRGAYRAQPSRRVWIDKDDGRKRPLGIAALEDKIVQSAVVQVLNPIWEEDFLDFSYGFRPGRKQHDALDALYVGITSKKVNFVLDLDIRSFFDQVGHDHMEKVRTASDWRRTDRPLDPEMVAGGRDGGRTVVRDEGRNAARGGDIAVAGQSLPALRARSVGAGMAEEGGARRRDRGAVRGRAVLGFQYREAAEQFLADLQERVRKFGLELHPEKTRLLEFGRYAAERRGKRGAGKPETFNFLGFTHICGKNHATGYFMVYRKTIGKRMAAKLKKIRQQLRQRVAREDPGHHGVAAIGGSRIFPISRGTPQRGATERVPARSAAHVVVAASPAESTNPLDLEQILGASRVSPTGSRNSASVS